MVRLSLSCIGVLSFPLTKHRRPCTSPLPCEEFVLPVLESPATCCNLSRDCGSIVFAHFLLTLFLDRTSSTGMILVRDKPTQIYRPMLNSFAFSFSCHPRKLQLDFSFSNYVSLTNSNTNLLRSLSPSVSPLAALPGISSVSLAALTSFGTVTATPNPGTTSSRTKT